MFSVWQWCFGVEFVARKKCVHPNPVPNRKREIIVGLSTVRGHSEGRALLRSAPFGGSGGIHKRVNLSKQSITKNKEVRTEINDQRVYFGWMWGSLSSISSIATTNSLLTTQTPLHIPHFWQTPQSFSRPAVFLPSSSTSSKNEQYKKNIAPHSKSISSKKKKCPKKYARNHHRPSNQRADLVFCSGTAVLSTLFLFLLCAGASLERATPFSRQSPCPLCI